MMRSNLLKYVLLSTWKLTYVSKYDILQNKAAIASSKITMCRYIVPIEIDFILEIYQQKTREASV